MLIYLRGEDTFRAREAIRSLKQKFRLKHPDGHVRQVSEAVNWSELISFDLWQNPQLIIIEEAAQLGLKDQTALVRLIKQDESVIWLIWDGGELKDQPLRKGLAAADRIINVEPLSREQLAKWLNRRIERDEIDGAALNRLSQMGNDLWFLDTELALIKLGSRSYSTLREQIEPREIYRVARKSDSRSLAGLVKIAARTGLPAELVIAMISSALASVSRVNRDLVELLADLDVALKSGLLDGRAALTILSSRLLELRASRIQWEELWLTLAT